MTIWILVFSLFVTGNDAAPRVEQIEGFKTYEKCMSAGAQLREDLYLKKKNPYREFVYSCIEVKK